MDSGTIDLDGGAAANDGLLSVVAGDLITVTYFDEDNGQGLPTWPVSPPQPTARRP